MSMAKAVLTGLDQLESSARDLQRAHRPRGASARSTANPSTLSLCLRSKKFKLTTLFGPQHGILGQTQDNMVEWEGFRDPATGLHVYSLYGATRKPAPEMLADIDVLVVDLQDVGSRYYTFIWTLELCMQACHETGKSLIVLDLPNPWAAASLKGPWSKNVMSRL
jgi:uncharacterized protein YbbC (DUF1343 family)